MNSDALQMVIALAVISLVVLGSIIVGWYYTYHAKSMKIGSTFWVRAEDIEYQQEEENGRWMTGDQWVLRPEARVLPFALNLAWALKFLPQQWLRARELMEEAVWDVQINKYDYDIRAGGADYRVEKVKKTITCYQHTLEVGTELSDLWGNFGEEA